MLHELAAALRPGGRFLVQTREPEHHAVQAFTRRSFSYFAERELPLRREAGYPPYGEIALVDAADTELDALAPTLRAAGAAVLGPISARRGLSRILVRAPSVTPLLEPLRAFALEHPRSRIEIDPVDVA
jgi:primosomal protein N' (replication factor Y)